MREELFQGTQEVPLPRDQVFAFFADPSNLQLLTPPWLDFRICTPQPLPVGEGAVYDYQLKIRGLPIRWRTLIEAWEPGRRFVDRQIQGPYALWHHTHRFEDLPDGGTRLVDQVRWRLGFGPLGRLAVPLVRRDIAAIFGHRQRVIAERMGSRP